MLIYDSKKNTEETKTFEEMLAACGRTEKDIEKIYYGLDHHCRCGCGGDYFRPGESGFISAIDRMKEETFETTDPESLPYNNSNKAQLLNIPEDDQDNVCYCIYFKESE